MSPKHRDVSRQLRAEIATGKYGVSRKLPSEAQLVKRFAVSRPTIDRALRDLQSEGLIERRVGSGSYVRDPEEGALDARQLGLLLPGLGTTEIFELLCGELASLARAHEYSLLLGGPGNTNESTDTGFEEALKLCDQFIARKVTGVFFAPFELRREKEGASRQLAEKLRQAGIPVVLLDRDLIPFPRRSEFDLVSIDNFSGGYLLAEHLIKLGSKTIAFVARPFSAPSVDARVAGVREALVDYHLEAKGNWIHYGEPSDPKFIRNLTAGKPWDAIVCANDHTAAVMLRALELQKVGVPRDIRVVGFDDVKYATLLSVPLTTINQPCRNISITAFRAMMERIQEPTLPARSMLLPPSLIVRESCGAYLPR